ncbi:protein FAM92A1 [Elysia marginata]|uniref:Protein FAM92A1 n=1 Tax=Elysia marginata TaxID=1093978 RepID=A0AAV4FCF6_9GAST|nr:protein FAM92A1 [Elysia marginata]
MFFLTLPGDLFAHHLKEYAQAEKLNNSSTISLTAFAENFAAVQDYRDTEIKRLEEKVLKPFVKYGTVCKNMKSTVKNNQNAWERERKQLTKLEKLHQKLPASDPQVVSFCCFVLKLLIKAMNDLQRMRQETGIYGENLISEIDQFERNKLADMKAVLNEFVQIEMMFHARALKYLSECYEAVQSIDSEVDMDQFRGALLEASGLSRSFTQTGGSSSLGTSTAASGTLTSKQGFSLNGSPSNQEMHRPSPRQRRHGATFSKVLGRGVEKSATRRSHGSVHSSRAAHHQGCSTLPVVLPYAICLVSFTASSRYTYVAISMVNAESRLVTEYDISLLDAIPHGMFLGP